MTIHIGPCTFDRVRYDADADAGGRGGAARGEGTNRAAEAR
jgi:hypothetical protein